MAGTLIGAAMRRALKAVVECNAESRGIRAAVESSSSSGGGAGSVPVETGQVQAAASTHQLGNGDGNTTNNSCTDVAVKDDDGDGDIGDADVDASGIPNFYVHIRPPAMPAGSDRVFGGGAACSGVPSREQSSA